MTREEAISQLISLSEEDVNVYSDAVEYAIEALEQESCEDCVSRSGIITKIENEYKGYTLSEQYAPQDFINLIEDMPPVQPKQRAGHWITLKDEYDDVTEAVCSCCDKNGNHKWAFCPNCGTKMQEVEE